MPVIAIKKTFPVYEFATKKQAENAICACGEKIEDYKIVYAYDKMRKSLSKSYKKRHNEAALRYYHKNKQLKGKENGRKD